jgi:hypothetical protein
MHPYLIYALIAVLVILCLKSFITTVIAQYWEEFFNDPTGGIIPVEERKDKKTK